MENILKKTPLYKAHEKLNAKIVEFAGYRMPVYYSSITAEHKAVREAVGIFDVSHMGEVFVKGPRALDFVQKITVNDASVLFPGRVQYSAMCLENGGIVDDLLVYRIADDHFMLVINASNIEKDFAWMQKNNTFGVELKNESEDYALIAIQGPNSRILLEKLFGKEFPMEYYHFVQDTYKGKDFIVSRTGYTGELGYELYFKGDEEFACALWDKIFELGAPLGVQATGLGARDSLRLEMGFCLYGNDIDETTHPLEAGLGWITKLKKPAFNGKDVMVAAKEAGLKRKLVAMIADEKSFPRHGYEVQAGGKKIGVITSGTVSPVLDKGIALAYVESEFSKEGSKLNFVVRGKEFPATVTKLPFIKK